MEPRLARSTQSTGLPASSYSGRYRTTVQHECGSQDMGTLLNGHNLGKIGTPRLQTLHVAVPLLHVQAGLLW